MSKNTPVPYFDFENLKGKNDYYQLEEDVSEILYNLNITREALRQLTKKTNGDFSNLVLISTEDIPFRLDDLIDDLKEIRHLYETIGWCLEEHEDKGPLYQKGYILSEVKNYKKRKKYRNGK